MVNYLCLPPPHWKPADRAVCMISGWGLQDGNVDEIHHEISQRNSIIQRKKFADSRIGLIRHVETEECTVNKIFLKKLRNVAFY